MSDELIALRAAMLLIPQPHCALIWHAYVQLTVRNVVYQAYIQQQRDKR
jgi:hypothetical protein